MMSRGKYICSLMKEQTETHDEQKDKNVQPKSEIYTNFTCDLAKNDLTRDARAFKNNIDITDQPGTSKGTITQKSSNTYFGMRLRTDTASSDDNDNEDSLSDNLLSDHTLSSDSEYSPESLRSSSEDTSSNDSDNEPLSNKVLKSKQKIIPSLQSGSAKNTALYHITADSSFQQGTVDHIFEQRRETIKKKIFQLKEKTLKKRPKNPEEWKKRKSAIAREKGEEYRSQTGKIMPKKEINPGLLCKEKCRLKCFERFDLEARRAILRKYYSLNTNAKNSLLFKSLVIKPVARHRANTKKAKTYSFTYSVTFNKKTEIVCRDAICSLYQLGRKKIERIQNMLKKGQSAPSPDKRGCHKNRPHKLKEEVVACILAHIEKFPAEESHYSRNKNGYKKYLSPLLNVTQMYKMYLKECESNNLDKSFKVTLSSYVKIFSTKFNLSFGQPRSDTFSVCDSGENSVIHTENYKAAFESQKCDRKKPGIKTNTCYITMDLQQTMPLPKLTTRKAFYLRQMWYYNFGIHCITSGESKPFFFNWTEDIANRGSLEIASCLLRFCQLLQESHKNVDHLIIWSDSCAGQNKNFNIISLYQFLILNGTFKVIDHKFPEVGHSYLDSDRNFGRIEKKLRKVENIYVPDQYSDLIKSASTKNSAVVNMENYFYDFEELPTKLHLFNKKTNMAGDKVNFRDEIKWIRVDEFGSYLYKTNVDEYSPFHKVDRLKKGSRAVTIEDNVTLSRIQGKRGSISSEKINNLREQLKFVKDEYKWFYENILEGSQENAKKKRKTK